MNQFGFDQEKIRLMLDAIVISEREAAIYSIESPIVL